MTKEGTLNGPRPAEEKTKPDRTEGHTPGPWYADHDKAPTAIRSSVGEGYAICHVHETRDIPHICAAPETARQRNLLLEAAEKVCGLFTPGSRVTWSVAKGEAALRELRAAIAECEEAA